MCHVSPERLDFKTFYPGPIPNGLNNTCVNVVGMGDIELIGPNLTPHNVLFVSSSSIRLISVKMLSQSCDFTSHFSIDGCWITNNSSSVIARGVAMGSPASNLYELRARVQAEQQAQSVRQPLFDKWHPPLRSSPPAPKPLIPNPPLRCSAHMPVLPTSRILTNDSLSGCTAEHPPHQMTTFMTAYPNSPRSETPKSFSLSTSMTPITPSWTLPSTRCR